jgi:flagellar hook-length control protein FliK
LEQTDLILANLLQKTATQTTTKTTQSTQTNQTTQKDLEETDFQDLMRDKVQAVQEDAEPAADPAAAVQTTVGKTGKAEKAVADTPQEDQEDELLRQLSVAQLLSGNAVAQQSQDASVQTVQPQQESQTAALEAVGSVETAPTASVDLTPEIQTVQQPDPVSVEPTVPEQTAVETTVETVETAVAAELPQAAPETPVAETPRTTEALSDDVSYDVAEDVDVNQVQTVTTTEPTQQKEQSAADDLPAETSQSRSEDDKVQVTDVQTDASQPLFPNVADHMIKVGESSSTLPSQAPDEAQDVEDQVLQGLTEALDQGETKVELQLQPEALGKVTVEVTAQKDGALQVVLTAESSHTRQLLGQHMDGLRDLLAGQSQKPVQIEVPRQESGEGKDARYDGSGNGHPRQQQEQHRQRQQESSQDFLQQLRLGLVPLSVN